MIIKEKQENTINLAWERLYKRMEQDNLLPKKEVSYKRSIFNSSGLKWAASAAIFCLCLIPILLVKQHTKNQETKLLSLHNEINSPTLVTALEDGSVIYLSEQATIHYPEHFQDDKRTVTLQGNAFFEVSKQPERPFIIDTDIAKIEVLGTFFYVKNNDKSSFLLSVRNGEVQVTLKQNNQIIHVKDGETAVLESGYLQLKEADMNQFDNYFEKISFKDERLADIVRIINLNSNSKRIEISPELGDRRLTTDFSGETPETMAELICTAMNLNCSQHQNIIYITK